MQDQRSRGLDSVERLNRSPLNQDTKIFLEEAIQDLSPQVQHLYQLLLWGLEEGEASFRESQWAGIYQPFLWDLAFQEDQQEAYQYLVGGQGDPEEALLDPGDLERAVGPSQAAQTLLDTLQAVMTEDEDLRPSFPPNTQPRD